MYLVYRPIYLFVVDRLLERRREKRTQNSKCENSAQVESPEPMIDNWKPLAIGRFGDIFRLRTTELREIPTENWDATVVGTIQTGPRVGDAGLLDAIVRDDEFSPVSKFRKPKLMLLPTRGKSIPPSALVQSADAAGNTDTLHVGSSSSSSPFGGDRTPVRRPSRHDRGPSRSNSDFPDRRPLQRAPLLSRGVTSWPRTKGSLGG